MGTWGFLPLDNDTAADWCGELDDAAPSERPEMVANALQYAIKTRGNMWLDNTQVAIAAAAVVASQLEDGPLMTTAYGPDFILAGGSLDVVHLAPLAAQALNEFLTIVRLLGDQNSSKRLRSCATYWRPRVDAFGLKYSGLPLPRRVSQTGPHNLTC